MSGAWPWIVLVLLGAYHGVNPAMGWLFAVARGLQEQRRAAVLLALPAIALGHAAAVGSMALVVSGAGEAAGSSRLRTVGAATLVLFGCFKLFKPRSHPRWVGMRVTQPELAVWSFLMATAHGAGLMLFPVLLALARPGGSETAYGEVAHASHMMHSMVETGVAVLVHTIAMFLAMSALAIVVYERASLAVLRRAWVNLDGVWAVTIVVAGVFSLFT